VVVSGIEGWERALWRFIAGEVVGCGLHSGIEFDTEASINNWKMNALLMRDFANDPTDNGWNI